MYLSSLEKYKDFLDNGTHDNQDYSLLGRTPKSRFHTLDYVLTNFANNVHRTVVELGTTRSYVHGGHPDCNTDNISAWTPFAPLNWDWGAGFFTYVVAEALQLCNMNFRFHTVDISGVHITRCRRVTEKFRRYMTYHVRDSVEYLRGHTGKIDLLYMDTGDMWPIEPTAEQCLAEAKIVVERNLITPYGLILIDDVGNTTPLKLGETSKLGKAKYALPFLLSNGFEMVMNEYQIILRPT